MLIENLRFIGFIENQKLDISDQYKNIFDGLKFRLNSTSNLAKDVIVYFKKNDKQYFTDFTQVNELVDLYVHNQLLKESKRAMQVLVYDNHESIHESSEKTDETEIIAYYNDCFTVRRKGDSNYYAITDSERRMFDVQSAAVLPDTLGIVAVKISDYFNGGNKYEWIEDCSRVNKRLIDHRDSKVIDSQRNDDDRGLESNEGETFITWENENNFEEVMKDYIENEPIKFEENDYLDDRTYLFDLLSTPDQFTNYENNSNCTYIKGIELYRAFEKLNFNPLKIQKYLEDNGIYQMQNKQWIKLPI